MMHLTGVSTEVCFGFIVSIDLLDAEQGGFPIRAGK